MKHIIPTILVFGAVIILLIGGAYLFQSFDGMDSIKQVDNAILKDINKVMGDNTTDNVTDNATDNATKRATDNFTDNVTDNATKSVTDNMTDNSTKRVTGNVTVTENLAGVRKEESGAEKSVESFFNPDSIKENLKSGLDKLSGIFGKNGMSLDKIKENENIKSFLDSIKDDKPVVLDNETMKRLLDNQTLEKIFNAEGMALDSKNVEKILNSPAVKEFFKTGKTSDADNKTLQSMFENILIRELVLNGVNDNDSKPVK